MTWAGLPDHRARNLEHGARNLDRGAGNLDHWVSEETEEEDNMKPSEESGKRTGGKQQEVGAKKVRLGRADCLDAAEHQLHGNFVTCGS